MTNEQMYFLFAGQVVTILAVFLASLLGARGITLEIALTNKRIDDLRQEMTGRLEALTGGVRTAIQ
jgi:hypothetical protein